MSQPPAERKYNYKDHRDIEPEMIDYLLSVADVSNVYALDIGHPLSLIQGICLGITCMGKI